MDSTEEFINPLLSLVNEAIKDGTDLNKPHPLLGMNLLHFAAVKDNIEAYNALKKAGAKIDTVNPTNNYTPLHMVALNNSINIAKALVKERVDVNATASNGFNPLHLAAETIEGNSDSVSNVLIEAVDFIGNNTPLHIAAGAGNIKMAEVLMEAGADPSKENNFGFIPLELEFIQKIKEDFDRKQQVEGLKELTTTRKKRRNSNDFTGEPNPKKRIRRSYSF